MQRELTLQLPALDTLERLAAEDEKKLVAPDTRWHMRLAEDLASGLFEPYSLFQICTS